MGRKLRLLRKKEELTIEELAEKLDLSSKIISNYENGKNKMTIDTIIKIDRNMVFEDKSLEELVQIFILDIF
ncbi:helix-turn-helix transcriptional regulator [Mammaliicoccus sp. I-M36]|uniref:helix-turn-helix domain-containing protein n=1 Tax=Mammaliicoccus sp. I-M36 TaxID=2898695 RepID=UPI001EFB4568|nr:helix-turn-helix transcriptional regulator [Mammaliicoccus sp. I-M36]